MVYWFLFPVVQRPLIRGLNPALRSSLVVCSFNPPEEHIIFFDLPLDLAILALMRRLTQRTFARRLVAFWLILLLTGSSLVWLLPREAVVAQSPIQTIFDLVNQFRIENGLPAFTWDNALAAAAQEQANYMAEFNIYSHTGYGGSRPYDRAFSYGYRGWVSENIVGGTNLTPRAGLIWWINSPVHLNTLLTSRYVEAGTGFAFGFEQNFYALVVGLPDDAPQSAPTVPDDSPAPIFVTPIEVSAPGEDGSIIHVVQEGQTAWAIAAVYEVELNYILLINNLESGGFLVPGDTLVIQLGEGQAPPPTPTPPSTHFVKEGETLWSIAARYDLTVNDLLWYNGIQADEFLTVGAELVVRLPEGQAPPPTPTPQQTHIVQGGETLSGIAFQYGIPLTDLLAWNSLTADAILQINQELRIRPLPVPTETVQPPATEPPASATPTMTVTPAGDAAAVALPAETVASAQLAPLAAPPTPTLVPTVLPAQTVQADTAVSPIIWIVLGLMVMAGAGVVMIRRAF